MLTSKLETNCTTLPAKVDYCLAEAGTQHCTVRISVLLLAIVIACNVLKTICLAVTAFSRKFEPLATVGDAVASFLGRSDDWTLNVGPVSFTDVREIQKSPNGTTTLEQFRRVTRRWGHGASSKRWLLCMIVCVAVWIAGLVLLLMAAHTDTGYTFDDGGDSSNEMSLLWSQGIGHLSLAAMLKGPPGNDMLIPYVLLANAPQIVISFAYLFYNNVFTCMVLANEWSQFGHLRKGLRVSRPVKKSAQRSTFWLQLPYRYIVPVMVLMTLLHWLTARSIFFVQMSIYDVVGNSIPSQQINGCAYSPLAIFFALIVGGILIILIVGCSLFKLDPGVPLAGSCSLAISAAAHAGADETDVVFKPLKYGVVVSEPEATVEGTKAGLSSREVRPLLDGGRYS